MIIMIIIIFIELYILGCYKKRDIGERKYEQLITNICLLRYKMMFT